MNKSSDEHNNLIRSLDRKPSPATIQEASDRVWGSLERTTMLPNTPPTRRFLNASPLIVGVMTFALVALIGSTSYLAVQQSKLRKEVALNNAAPQNNSVVILPDNGGQFFVPQNPATPTPTTAPTATPNKKSTPTPFPTKLARLNLTDDLYNFSSKEVGNATSGVRKSSIASSSGFFAKAYADDVYPAVYYVDYTRSANAVTEVNMYTGETRIVVRETGSTNPQPIVNLTFNSTTQDLVYGLSKSSDASQASYDIIRVNVNSGRRTVVAENMGFSWPKWSPDMKHLAVPYSNKVASGYENKVRIYGTDLTNPAVFDMPENGVPYGYTWSGDSASLGFETMVSGVVKFVSMNVNDGSQTVSPIYPAGHIASDSARLMGNNVYGFRNDNNNPQHPINDWFYKFDRGSQSFTDYRDQTIFTNTNAPFVWLGTKDMKSIVYMVSSWPGGGVTSNTLYKFNLETSTRTELKLNDNLKNAQTRIVGWNGNEENVILWDNSNIFWNLNTTTDELTQITG